MGLGVIALILSVLCLIATLGFGAPIWVNIVGIALGFAGLFLLGKGRRGDGA
jgi:hypothetical protein